ncbi:MAG: ferrochelatase [Bacteroidetes bacterium]|nr:ferrochelatase [Bacteroidota bacterium]
MTGILLVNMGGASSPKELKVFLARMFKDPYILPFGAFGRNFLSFIISNTRYKSSWKKYELIGGSPIIESTKKTVISLQNELGDDYVVKMAFSYSAPFIDESIASFIDNGIYDITVIPLYPQSSFSTTSSVATDVKNATANYQNCNISFVKEFYLHENFIKFWANQIKVHINKNNLINPYLVFSAHSIPKYLVDKGDTYANAIEASAKAIAGKLNLNCEHAYQSGMKRGEWIGPDTKKRLMELKNQGKEEIILIPISFVNENLETLYDLDYDIIPYAKNKLGFSKISRVEIPVADKDFIELLKDIAIK